MTTSIPCASLYVGDLHPEVTEAVLFDRFQQHGNVLSIRVCRDLVTRKSLGYAYVNYQNSGEAKAAMDQINFEDILGRPCRIMWSQRDPAARRSGVGNIFIKNLDPTITVKEINDTFANFGEITSCKLQMDDTGNSKGFAFVNFSREEDAEKAIQAINGKMIRDKIVFVAKFVPRQQRMSQIKDYTNCYVKNFDTLYDDEGLKKLFEVYGEIVSAKVMVDREGKSKGFGFVSFKEHESAVDAVNKVNGMQISERTIYVGRAMKKAERQRELKARYEKIRQERMQQHKSGVNLYIKNLGNDMDDNRLRQEFSVYGNITSAKVMLNKENNTSKGFGFVCFSAPDEATKAVSEMNGKIVDGKPLYVALAQKKEDRVAHLRQQFTQRMPQAQPPMFNQNMMQFMNIQNAARTLIPRTSINVPNRWPAGPIQFQNRNNIMGLPTNQNPVMMAPQQQRRPVVMDNIAMQNRQSRPITGNVQQPRAFNMVASNGNRNMIYPYGDAAASVPSTIDPKAEREIPENMNQLDLNTTSQIANANAADAKQIIGERIYPIVAKYAGDMAGKITGMFLELDNTELLHMMENEMSMKIKIEEAMVVLNQHKGVAAE